MVSAADLELGPGELVRLTTAQPNAAFTNTQRLRRVAWRLNDGVLSRVTWVVLDRDQDSTEYERVLLDGVSDLVFSFLTYNENNALEAVLEWQNQEFMPSGIEVFITLDSGRQYRRLFELTTGV